MTEDQRRTFTILGLALVGAAGVMYLGGAKPSGPGPAPGPAPTPPATYYLVFDAAGNLLLRTGDRQLAIIAANNSGCGAYVRYEAGDDRPTIAYRAPCPPPAPPPPAVKPPPVPVANRPPPPAPPPVPTYVYYQVRNLNGSVRWRGLDRAAAINLADSLHIAAITVWQEGPTDGTLLGNIVAAATAKVIYQVQGGIARRSGFAPTRMAPAPGAPVGYAASGSITGPAPTAVKCPPGQRWNEACGGCTAIGTRCL